MKSKSSAFNSTFSICLIITIMCMFALLLTKNVLFVGILIGIGVVPVIMIITQIISYSYYNKRN